MMITVQEARVIFAKHPFKACKEQVPLMECYGRILAEPIHGERDAPPFDRVMMDGIAIQNKDLGQFDRFNCIGQQFAGDAPKNWEVKDGDCVETATGAVLPANTDRVLPYEWLKQEGDSFILVKPKEEIIGTKSNIHQKGSDRRAGALSIEEGSQILAPEVAVLASEGKTHPWVYQLPRTAVISTGNELVDLSSKPKDHEIRRSNVFMLLAMLKRDGINASAFHLNDEEADIENWLDAHLKDFDLLIFSGGVSMGKKDHLPDVFQEKGIHQYFHKVKQRPGKPLWFGGNDRITVFGLPGNPVSSMVAYSVHVRTWLGKVNSSTARLTQDVQFNPAFTRFLPVRLKTENGIALATSVGEQGSGDFESLVGSDGVIELPLENSEFHTGDSFHFYPFHV